MALIGLVHTTRLVIEPVHEAFLRNNPGAEVNHVLDEGILRRLAHLGHITPEIVDWLTRMVLTTENSGADLAVVSCSSLSPCVNQVRERVGIPVLKVDEPMVEHGIEHARRIGLLMTNPTTQEPSTMLVEEVSDRLGKSIDLVPVLCPDAFAKLNRGDIDGHDSEVVEAINLLLEDVDLVMLAQISIARVRQNLPETTRSKVLSSLDFIERKCSELLGKPSLRNQ